jgi:hypothetical protein
MRYILSEKEQLKILCAKSVGMALGGNLRRG